MKAGERVYLDTSGIVAFMDADDEFHGMAKAAWKDVLSTQGSLLTTDFVRLESWSLIQRRLGIEAVEDFYRTILPQCRVDPVGEDGFELLAGQVILGRRRSLSLVDLSGFACMRRHGIHRALAFDRHFSEQGFATPASDQW